MLRSLMAPHKEGLADILCRFLLTALSVFVHSQAHQKVIAFVPAIFMHRCSLNSRMLLEPRHVFKQVQLVVELELTMITFLRVIRNPLVLPRLADSVTVVARSRLG